MTAKDEGKGSFQWTFLRPGYCADNFAGQHKRDIVEDNRIYVPAGNTKV